MNINLESDLSPNAQVLLVHLLKTSVKGKFLTDEFLDKTKDELVEKGYLLSKKEMVFSKAKLSGFQIESVEDWIEEYRKLFKGVKIGVMGDPKACLNKMKEFLSENNYTKQQILDATKKYIATTDPRFLQQADYFISKRMGDGVLTSRLRNYCEEVSERSGDYEEFESPFKLG